MLRIMLRIMLMVLILVGCGGGALSSTRGDAGDAGDVGDAGDAGDLCALPDAGDDYCPVCPVAPTPCFCTVGVDIVMLTDQRWACPTIECTGHCGMATMVLESVDVCHCID